MRLLIFTFPS